MPQRVASWWAQVARWGVLPLAFALGIAVERESASWSDPLRWLPDLVVGLVLVGAAKIAWAHQRPVGVLLGLAGLSWFLGTLWSPVLFVHVALIIQLLVTVPGWRPRSNLDVAAVAVGYGVAVAMPSWRSDVAVVGVAVGLVLVLGRAYVRSGGATRRQRRVALVAGAGFASALLASALLRTVVPSGHGVEPALVLHELAVCAVAVGLVSAFRRPPATLVTDLVVELEETRSGTLRDALASTLGDPTLQVGYVTDDGDYLDAHGDRVVVPPSDGGRTATLVERDGRPFAVLVHDSAVLDEPTLVAAVSATTLLTGSNAALRTEVSDRVDQVDASRRRLLLAADEEQARLEERLRGGAERRLEELQEVLGKAVTTTAEPPEHVDRARHELAQTLADLRALAHGLRPRELEHGLRGALGALVARSPLDIDLAVSNERYPGEVEMTAWFVCAEAVANAVKHADAGWASIVLSRHGDTLVVIVTDDGCGGADVALGTGLRGLADRVDAVGGSLRIDSPVGSGTRVMAALPVSSGP